MKDKIIEYVINAAKEVSVDKTKKIEKSTLLKKDLMISSLDFVKILISVEGYLEIELPEELLLYDFDTSIEQLADVIYLSISSMENKNESS